MAANARDDEFDEYDKPGAERSRRRRGEDDDLDSDLEGDLLEEDWLSSKKNPSELSDEELNDDLLQSDEEDHGGQGEGVSLNATLGLSTSYDLHGKELEEEGYTGEGCGLIEEQEAPAFSQEHEEYRVEEYGDEEGMEYTASQNEEGYEDEVLDLQINEPLDDEFQVNDYSGEYGAESQEEQPDQQEIPEGEEPEEEREEQDNSVIAESEEVEAEAELEVEQEADMKEESDEDEEDNEESGRQRFKTERKDVTVVRLSDAASKRRNIPETLELTEEAKADLLEFEEKERVRKQGRFCGRGRVGGLGGRGVPFMGTRGRGGGGGGRGMLPLFRMGDFRGDGSGGRGRINERKPPLMQVNLGMQPRMAPPQSHHHQPRPHGPRGGPGLFPNPVGPLSQQPLQLLMPHRSPGPLPPPPRPQPELHGPRGMGTPPPPAHTHPNQQQQQQPKNIHINPHFRGPSSSPVQVSLMAPAQNQPRPNIGPQRFPGPVDFQQHLQGNFVQPQRPPPQEQWRGPPPPHQERDSFFGNEPRFPGQHMFDLPGPAPLMNNNILPLGGPGPLSFPPPGGLGGAPGPGPGFGPLAVGQGPAGGGMFQREPPRASLPPQHTGPPAPPGPRGFMGPRQPFPPQQQGPPFSPQHIPFGLQVRQRNIMQPHSQPQPHDPPLSHHALHQQHLRQDVPQQGHPQPHPLPPHNQQQHHQHQRQSGEQHPIMHLSHPPFRQPLQGGPRQMQLRPQNGPQRNNPGRLRMVSPSPLQQLQNAPQRNSNLRELPIATSSTTTRPSQPPAPTRPLPRLGPDMRPSQGVVGGAMGRGRGMAKALPLAVTSEAKKATPAPQPSITTQDPEEDEETRQYRLKIEEQKRLREEVLRRKELRRQMQAGVRKKELLERIGSQTHVAPAPPASSQPPPATPPPQPVPLLAPNGAAPTPPAARPSAKSRLQASGPEPQVSRPETSQKAPWQQQQQQQGRPMNPQNPLRQGPPLPNSQSGGSALGDTQGPGPAQPQPLRPGGKRTVMQRTSSPGSAHIPPKVRVVKRLGEAGPNPSTPPQHQQEQQPIGRPVPQQRLGAIRKVTVATGSAPQQQEASCGMVNQTNRVVVPGRGRGRGAPGGRGGGRMMMQANRQNSRGPDLQPSTVSIDGLSSSTTEKQIKNLLNSIGPIQMFKMLPQQRKAIAKFVNPQHALSFQHSFHRHMIDLSHIDVTIIDG